MPPFDHGEMEGIFDLFVQSQNMPPFDHGQMGETFKLLNNVLYGDFKLCLMLPFECSQMVQHVYL
jgi:hypothetical protein